MNHRRVKNEFPSIFRLRVIGDSELSGHCAGRSDTVTEAHGAGTSAAVTAHLVALSTAWPSAVLISDRWP